jgi:two-component system chemotaxis response regulator CheB
MARGSRAPAKARAGARPRIIVVGASAGGFSALVDLVGQLPAELPAAVFAVLHMAPDFSADVLVNRLNKRSAFPSKVAEHDEHFRVGRVYVAPAGAHLLLERDVICLRKGAHENRYRPAIDPLFRSAAVSHGASVIGVVLTGMLDDGTSGLVAIERCGGLAVVQDPADAAFPAMPQSALDHVKVTHKAPLAEMGALLERLVGERPPRRRRPPKDVVAEAIIAARVVSNARFAESLGARVSNNCPTCGAALVEIAELSLLRYRCQTGHAFTASALLAAQEERIEETLWITLRMLEERRNLNAALAARLGAAPSKIAQKRAKEIDAQIARIREVLGASAG